MPASKIKGTIVGKTPEQTPAPRISDRAILASGAAVTLTWLEMQRIRDACAASEDISTGTKEKITALYRYARLKAAYNPMGKTTVTAK